MKSSQSGKTTASVVIERQWKILDLLTDGGAWKTVQNVHDELREAGFKVHLRTIQRDLRGLPFQFPDLEVNEGMKPYGWRWRKGSKQLLFNKMDAHTALSFYLMEQHISTMLPPATLDVISPHFATARRVLDGRTSVRGVQDWCKRQRNHIYRLTIGPA